MPLPAWVGEVEAALREHSGRVWRPMDRGACDSRGGDTWQAAWCSSVAAEDVRCPGVTALIVALPAGFPCAQPLVLIDRAPATPPWPHVESFGRLCLRATRLNDSPAARVLQHLAWADELLQFSAARCAREFAREFRSYWARAVIAQRKRTLPLLSLVSPRGESREIAFIRYGPGDQTVAADDRQALLAWLRHRGWAAREKAVRTTWLQRLPRPWAPADFPASGRDVLRHVPEHTLEAMLRAGGPHPVLFEASSASGPVFAAAVLQGPATERSPRGFRRAAAVPLKTVRLAWAGRPLRLCEVERVDGPWVHGRDHDPQHVTLRARTVAVVGCGALGSALACLLAQAGVGRLICVDGEQLVAPNTSRHALGMSALHSKKAEALAARLRCELPHLREVVALPRNFQDLLPAERRLLAGSALVVTAGVSLEGDACVDHWRQTLTEPPMHLCTWAEAFAFAGHAVLLCGPDSLMAAFDNDEQPAFRATDWPNGVRSVRTEAGCGHAFQPHSAVDLHHTIGLAARLALDALLGRASTSVRRVWFSDMAAVAGRGGRLRDRDSPSFTEREYKWD